MNQNVNNKWWDWDMMRICLNNRPCGWSELPSACPHSAPHTAAMFGSSCTSLPKSLKANPEISCHSGIKKRCDTERYRKKPPAQHIWGTCIRTMCYIIKIDANIRFWKSGCEAWKCGNLVWGIWGFPKMRDPKIIQNRLLHNYYTWENQWFGLAIL